ncbi:unnamed protein product [Diabrotica balteata]|uniref:MADF domain-containing protein n=1 Tax=Diabrotica balteata TaxID=107213 RepID=A0A9N9XI80_DIABA|nr:unnamed protein product [Diabrotica balteata]
MSWTRDQVLTLVEIYGHHNNLYNIKCASYKNKHARQSSLEAIAKELSAVRPGTTSVDISKKLNSLRATYLTQVKKVVAALISGAGGGDISILYYNAKSNESGSEADGYVSSSDEFVPSASASASISTSHSEVSLARSNTRSVSHFFRKAQLYDNNSLGKKSLDEALIMMICQDFQPFSIVKDKGFRKFVELLDSRYSLPNPDTLKTND